MVNNQRPTKVHADEPNLDETPSAERPMAEGNDAPNNQGSPAFHVVGIGASAGGLEALEEFLDALPPDTGMAFVIVTHQHPGHSSMLPELLSKDTVLPVITAAEGLKLKPNHIYVEPPGGQLSIAQGTLHRTDTGSVQAPKQPIDYFFHALAQDQGHKAICIVLSGTGMDGTLGLKAIKRESGITIAQDPDSAKYSGMPSSAIATRQVDYILTPTDIAKLIATHPKVPGLKATTETTTILDSSMQRIFILLRNRTGHDFSGYKTKTLQRRIQRRMNMNQIENPNQYVQYLQENPHEIDLLLKELLISVTSFFRDSDAWDALSIHMQQFIESRPDGDTLRIWVPGCATGEEVYSIAIIVRECLDAVKRHCDVQIFGTDLDVEAIEIARAGCYAKTIAADISPERLERFFIHADNGYRIRKEIREMAIFAQQNVIKDPPFTKLDMISCRNLLIYVNAELQKKLLPIFHYALKPMALLFLGTSETVGSFTNLFDTLDKKHKIFQSKENTKATYSLLPELPVQPIAMNDSEPPLVASPSLPKIVHVSAIIERFLLNRFAPACVVTNDQGDIIYIHGRTGDYLEPSQGRPRNNILHMAREGLKIELASALRSCVRKEKEIVREMMPVKMNGKYIYVDMTVAKIREPEAVRGLFIITFCHTPSSSPILRQLQDAPERTAPNVAEDGNRLSQLEDELQYMKESHQTMLEELETSNEELKSTNEELQSTNEELQSTNEELETSKEEMQSLNEELSTVNAELQSKVDELSQSNDDMQNLFNSTDIATIFLDEDMNIMRFTDQAKDLVMLRESDLGRPISDLASNLIDDDLPAKCREVLKTLVFQEAEVETQDGGCYLMRIMPYRTAENIISGLVITFVNISKLRNAEREAKARAYFESIVDTVREPLIVLDADLRVLSANKAFYQMFHTSKRNSIGKLIYELGSGQWNIEKLRNLLESILPKDTKLEDYELEINIPNDGPRSVLLNARRMAMTDGDLILLAVGHKSS